MTVLVSTGLGLPAEDWDGVRRALSVLLPGQTMMVVVDRMRERAETRASVRRGGLLPRVQVERLAAAASAAGAPPPYVVVGHSLGGLYAEAFARLCPAQTAGLVLVDADLPADSDGSGSRRGMPVGVGAATTSAVSTALRLTRVRAAGPALRRAMVWSGSVAAADPLTPARRRELYADPRTLVGMLDEHIGYRDLTRAVAALVRCVPLPKVPVTLVAAARWGRPLRRRNSSWIRAQLQRATSLGADLVVADDAAHLVMLDAPDLVAAAIAAMVVDPSRRS
jgi:pimeloyl-ACP methyl ester carboxylesterase